MARLSLSLVSIVMLLGCDAQHPQPQKPAAVEEEKPRNHWPDIQRLAEAKDYPAAAKLAVEALEGDCPNRQYAMWKWWESTFGDRKDYMELSQRFGECLFDVYEHSTPDRRRVIAETFGRPDFDVTKSAAELRLTVEKNKLQ